MTMYDELPDSERTGEDVASPVADETEEQKAQGLPEASDVPEEKQVPLKALEAERHRRQGFETQVRQQQQQIDMLIQSLQRQEPSAGTQRQQQPQPDVLLETEKWQQNLFSTFQQMLDTRVAQAIVGVTEEAMRDKHADYDRMIDDVFKPAAQADPALFQQMLAAKDPAKFAYMQAKRLQAERELGGDLDLEKLRAKVRAEVLAELEGKRNELGQSVEKLPVSLGSVGTSASASDRIPPGGIHRARDLYR